MQEAAGEEAAQCISARLRGISGRFMITVCIWVGQSVFRPAVRNPGLSCSHLHTLVPVSNRVPAGPRTSGWKLETDQRRLRVARPFEFPTNSIGGDRDNNFLSNCSRFCLRSHGCLDQFRRSQLAPFEISHPFELMRKRAGMIAAALRYSSLR